MSGTISAIKAKLGEYDEQINKIKSELSEYNILLDQLKELESEREKFLKMIGPIENDGLTIEQKKEIIRSIDEPSITDLLPNNIKDCHYVIVQLRKVIRLHTDK